MFKFSLFPFVLVASLSIPVLAENVRDPTSPMGRQGQTLVKEAKSFTLNSVLISPQRKLAIINGKTLREGQGIPGTNGVRVQRILAQSVILQHENRTWQLKLSPSVVKKY